MRRNPGDESGFTLLEVVVAMVIFTVFCAASLGLLLRTDDVTRGNLQRSAAANLAAEQIQIARSQNALSLKDLTRYQKVPSDAIGTCGAGANTSTGCYTIKQTTKYLASDSTTSVCSGSVSKLAYRLVTVSVTWGGMGSIQPVRTDTLKAIGVGSDGLGTTGALAVTVTGADGTGQSGQTVSLSDGSTATTADDGCAVFVGLTPGTYSATLNNTGYVGLTNEQTTTKSSVGVTAGTITRTSISYDTVRSMNIAFGSPVSGALVPSGLKMLLSSSNLAATTYAACPATSTPVAACATPPTQTATGIAKELYPAVYTVKMGTCTETAPSQTSVDLRPTSANGSTATVPMGAYTVNVVIPDILPLNIVGRTLIFTHASQSSGCTAGESFTLPYSTNQTTMMLPYGTWRVTLRLVNVLGIVVLDLSTSAVTLTPTNRTGSGTLLVQL